MFCRITLGSNSFLSYLCPRKKEETYQSSEMSCKVTAFLSQSNYTNKKNKKD